MVLSSSAIPSPVVTRVELTESEFRHKREVARATIETARRYCSRYLGVFPKHFKTRFDADGQTGFANDVLTVPTSYDDMSIMQTTIGTVHELARRLIAKELKKKDSTEPSIGSASEKARGQILYAAIQTKKGYRSPEKRLRNMLKVMDFQHDPSKPEVECARDLLCDLAELYRTLCIYERGGRRNLNEDARKLIPVLLLIFDYKGIDRSAFESDGKTLRHGVVQSVMAKPDDELVQYAATRVAEDEEKTKLRMIMKLFHEFRACTGEDAIKVRDAQSKFLAGMLAGLTLQRTLDDFA